MGLFHDDDRDGHPLAPWTLGDAAFWSSIQAQVPCSRGLLALGRPAEPDGLALLSTHALSAETARRWRVQLAEAMATSAPLAEGGTPLDEGSPASAEDSPAAAEGGAAPAAGEPVLSLSLPASSNSEQQWHLVLGRSDGGFEPIDRQLGLVALRRINAAFDHLDEPDLRRLLIGHDGRLLHVDPLSEAGMLRQPELLPRFIDHLRALVEQRWPGLDDDRVHNLPLAMNDQATWVRLRRLRATDDPASGPWYVELRPLTEHDAPPVGLVGDPRVARALAYLSDHYAEAPTLNDVAEAVQVSPYHFHRLFVRHTGISPKHYLLRTQLMVAGWLLRSTRRPIGDIATATGFASHGHFTATFHRHIGVSPTTFREGR